MKRILAALLVALSLPACALGEITMTELADSESGNRRVVFSAEAEDAQHAPDPALAAIDMQIEVRFAQEKAKIAMGRAGAVLHQTGTLYQDGKIASMGLLWKGEQASGREGCSAAGLTVSLETGMEIYLDELFTDVEGAVAAMEAILEADVLENMSDYMEYAELLPMPQDSYSIDERGLTVYWPEDRYRYFDGTSGSVTFYWHELADYIGEESPVYALAHPDVPYNPSGIETQCMSGELTGTLGLELGELIGNIAQWYPLADPDYTTDALVFPLERERGFAVEIPKYAETDEDETPVSAIRASCIRFAGLLTTGESTEVDVIKLLGEPAKETAFDEDAAFDAMLEPGRSLYYEVSGRVLQLHLDESGVLSCVILRSAMPESLY
ncbi:MAG: hypothetical protein IKK34_00225 [Clostridia bacterium]|nr:hypothetical protein [Clostridia bacterium]